MSGEDDTREGGFFSGWSRRKLAAKRQEAQESPAPEEETAIPVAAAPAPEDALDDEAIAALPSIDSITAGTDIKPFLAPGIPAHLKNAALRRIWSVTPGVRDYSDPAVDYAWDWNAPGGVPGGGGTLSGEGVARMVKDLIGGAQARDASPDALAEEADLEALAQAPTEAPEAEAPAPPEPVRRTVAAPPTKDVEKEAPREVAQAPQPRRHGGAVPE